MTKPDLVYTTFIKTTPEKLWEAITNPEFTRQYWAGNANISDWKAGAKWEHVASDTQTVRVTGKVLVCDPPKRLVLSWATPDALEDVSRVTFEIEAIEDVVQLNIVHGDFAEGSMTPSQVTQGWPRVLSNMKTYLETGQLLNIFGGKSCGQKEAA